jgi:hypothetical protein
VNDYYHYEHKCHEARERIEHRRREAGAERIARAHARARRQRRRRRAGLAAALELLLAARRRYA